VFGNKIIDTMKGTKISQLSPLTRKMNTDVIGTSKDLDEFWARHKIKEEIKKNLLRRMKGIT
jgi:hypothetical protein